MRFLFFHEKGGWHFSFLLCWALILSACAYQAPHVSVKPVKLYKTAEVAEKMEHGGGQAVLYRMTLNRLAYRYREDYEATIPAGEESLGELIRCSGDYRNEPCCPDVMRADISLTFMPGERLEIHWRAHRGNVGRYLKGYLKKETDDALNEAEWTLHFEARSDWEACEMKRISFDQFGRLLAFEFSCISESPEYDCMRRDTISVHLPDIFKEPSLPMKELGWDEETEGEVIRYGDDALNETIGLPPETLETPSE